MSSGHYFTTPEGAVMECLTKRGEEPDQGSQAHDPQPKLNLLAIWEVMKSA